MYNTFGLTKDKVIPNTHQFTKKGKFANTVLNKPRKIERNK